MKDNFEKALSHVLREEGGLADDVHDPGGLTKYGITLPTLSAFRRADVRRADLVALTREEAATIYRSRYWNAIAADELPAGVDLCLFDFAVNSGPGRAVKTLQAVLGVTGDGTVGPVTCEAVRSHDPESLLRALHKARLGFLQSLSVWRFFGRGWSRRNDRTLQAALALMSHSKPVDERMLQMKTTLENTKSVLQSRTVWANVIGLASLGLSLAGYGALDVGGLTDAMLQAVTAGSFIASTIFRITAQKRLS